MTARRNILKQQERLNAFSQGKCLPRCSTFFCPNGQRMSTAAYGTYSISYSNTYTYQSPGNPYAPSAVQDGPSGPVTLLTWDADGNLSTVSCSSPYSERHLCWTEDNRLQGYLECSAQDGGSAAYYNYGAGGERNIKLTSPRVNINQNALQSMQHPPLVYPTLYASALVTLTRHGYTKHYFEGSSRVCSKIGGGFANVVWDEVEIQLKPIESVTYDSLYRRQRRGVDSTFVRCMGVFPETGNSSDLYKVLKDNESTRNDRESAYYYHSDHLGSAAYLTDDAGNVSQTLNYLPYGEDWVDLQNSLDPRLGQYTFNGKEKDYESGFHYYGARYYWGELLTGWLSVDPMADKYPGISPYAYCAWNPVKLVDPDGRDWDPGTEKDVINPYRAEIRQRMTMIEKKRGNSGNTNLYADQYAEYQSILQELDDLENDHDHIYKIVPVSNAKYDGVVTVGNLQDNKRIINIEIKLKAASIKGNSIFRHMGTIAHELKHAHQFYQGRLGFILNEDGNQISSTNTRTLEREAFTRGDMFLDHNVTNRQPMKYDYNLDPSSYKLNSFYSNMPENDYSISAGTTIYWHQNHK